MMNIRIYEQGVWVVKKQPAPITKAQFAKAFGWQLYEALQVRAIELRALDQQNFVDQSLTGPIQTFWNGVLEVYEKTAKLDIRITKSLIDKIRQLQMDLDDFDAHIDKNLECTKAEHLLLGLSLANLCEDVRHFVRQIEITHYAIATGGHNKKLPNRPTDWEKKELFIQEVSNYQEIHGVDKYPPHNILSKRMARKGHKLPERTFRDWRELHRSGKFEKLVQDR